MLQIQDVSRSPVPVALFQRATSACDACPVRSISLCGCDEVSRSLAAVSKRSSKSAKSVLFEEGAPADFVLNIVRGAVLLSKSLADGRRQVIGIALPGDFLGLALTQTHGFTATALTELEFCRIERNRFSAVLDENPRLVRRLFATSANELTLAQDHMILLGRRTADEKVASFLLRLRDRWAHIRSTSARVDIPLTRQDIGDYLGLTLETVSRVFSRLAKRKVIAVIPDGVRILDLSALSELTAA
jgi:CRP/FNR family transcriptional regulator